MSPVHAYPPHYPTAWERLLGMMGRKNQPRGRKQIPRKVKGREKPPHKKGGGKK